MKKTKRRITLFITVAFAVVAFYAFFFVRDRVTVEEVRGIINRELAVGAKHQEIEYFFVKHGFEYGYERRKNIYRGIIRHVSRYPFIDKAVEVDVYLDDEKKFVKAKVFESFTFL